MTGKLAEDYSPGKITNPILKGFNPDPSICRVGSDYYIATSTFEWFPGVQIHHSNDLANWTLIAHPLNRTSQLDLKGHPDSCGVWAPCLTYDDGLFYLIYTDTRAYEHDFQVRHNYLVTAPDINGPWSEPVFLNSSGFDPSLFHDEDGRKWLTNVLWDHRPEKSLNHNRPAKYFSGIILQEYDPVAKSLTGPIKKIFSGSHLGLVEGSHLYQYNGYYYLLTAEGGTFAHHASLFARSKNIDGPYEVDPQGHFLSAATDLAAPLRRTGHGDWVVTEDGQNYFVHLCGRPLEYRGRSVMGRETAIQKLQWNSEGWLRLVNGGQAGDLIVDAPSADTLQVKQVIDQHIDFSTGQLPIDFQSPREALTSDHLSYTARPGYLRLCGQEAPLTLFSQSLIARRQQALTFSAQTGIDFQPNSFQQMAGLISYYNTKKFIYLVLSHNEELGRVLEVMMVCGDGKVQYPLGERISVNEAQELELRIDVDCDQWRGFWRYKGCEQWQAVLGKGYLDYSALADEVGGEHFTGSFIGVACHDLSGQKTPADFDYFSYKEGVSEL